MTIDFYGVVGNPVTHSQSPRIHALFAAQTGEALEYTAIQAPLDGFAETVRGFFARGGKGLNVTVPFKEQAWDLVADHTEAARLARAVNTLYLDPEARLWGANTDGPGLVRDLEHNLGVTLGGQRILLLGAGGAVRGVLQPLLSRGPALVVIANRTLARAEALLSEFSAYGPLAVRAFHELNESFDLVINGTSASLAGDIPPISGLPVREATLVYDMMYAARGTPFLQWAGTQGARRCADGLGMLVEQAAESFQIWRGVRPDTAPVLQQLRSFMA